MKLHQLFFLILFTAILWPGTGNAAVSRPSGNLHRQQPESRSAEYNRHIQAAQKLQKQNRHREAMQEMRAARALEEQHQFLHDKNLPVMLQVSGRVLFSEQIAKSRERLPIAIYEAKQHRDSAAALMQELGLEQRVEIRSEMRLLDKDIALQQCKINQHVYASSLSKGSRAMDDKNYKEAADQFAKAVEMKNSGCSISNREAEHRLPEARRAAEYKEALDNARQKIKDGRYEEGFPDYESAIKLYDATLIGRHFPQPDSLYAYAMQSTEAGLPAYASGYFARRGQGKAALALMQESLKKGYTGSSSRAMQEQLAAELAAYDFNTYGNKINPKQRAWEYIEGESALKYFRKAYIKKWKELQ